MKDIIFDPPTKFDFKCGDYVPFRDRVACGVPGKGNDEPASGIDCDTVFKIEGSF